MVVIAIPAVNIGFVGWLQAPFVQVMLRSLSQVSNHNSGEFEMIRGLKFASIPVRNQDASLKFFTEKLGFKVGTDQPFSEKQRWIELLIPGAETGLVLFTPDGHESRIGDFQPLSFWCEDVFATAKIMKSNG